MNTSTPAPLYCPPLMNDGRHATDYRPNADVNLKLQQTNNLQDSNAYRTFLVNNATAIMQQNLKQFEQNANCMPYAKTVDPNGADATWTGYDESIKYSPVL